MNQGHEDIRASTTVYGKDANSMTTHAVTPPEQDLKTKSSRTDTPTTPSGEHGLLPEQSTSRPNQSGAEVDATMSSSEGEGARKSRPGEMGTGNPPRIAGAGLAHKATLNPPSEEEIREGDQVSHTTIEATGQPSNQTNVGGLLGAVIGGILAVASVYGIYRVYFRHMHRRSGGGIVARGGELYIKYESTQPEAPPRERKPPIRLKQNSRSLGRPLQTAFATSSEL
ncbi:hypothetical protein C922_05583 [Plasmodium inui San Antonio 1]|uniref:Uncharacterized protein n=1 Tax=Plasmodium inui San Antonio 1 TaxID=1237626 RepID=W7A4M3_9APIC|nr:hypothetical protein C922_05583 [Plasmodium inui San Antonio 1]EUD64039.1 hypothetical protein C922_05583 [Plasmodium inui San Antonio 1]